MGYLFVDRILTIEDGNGGNGPAGGSGLKVIRRQEPFLRSGPEGPELPPSFLGEAVGQLAAWVAMSHCGFTRRPVAGLTAEVDVRGRAQPGDRVDLHVEIESLEDDAVHYHGEARIRGEAVLLLRDVVGPMLPMEDFDDPGRVKGQFQNLLRPREPAGEIESGIDELLQNARHQRERGPREASPSPGLEGHAAIDEILERSEHHILAVTCVSLSAPYLADHFPRNPVLPATLLMDAQVELAAELVTGLGLTRERSQVRAARLTNMKMRDFIRPGSRLLSEVRLLKHERGRATFELTSRLDRVVATVGLELVYPEEEGRGRP